MASKSKQKEREDTAGDARPLSNPVKVNRWGWESQRRRRRRRRMGWDGMGWERRGEAGCCFQASSRSEEGEAQYSLSLPCLVLSLRQLILSSLTLSRSPSFPSTTISETKTPPFICRLQKRKKEKCLGRKNGPQKTKRCGHRFDNIQGLFPSFERRLL